MIFIEDRLSRYPGRVSLKPVSGGGAVEYDMTRADDPEVIGTSVNKKLLNDIYGFSNRNTVFNSDGSITETDPDTGASLKTVFNPDGSITETMFSENKTQKKTTTFLTNGSIKEVLG